MLYRQNRPRRFSVVFGMQNTQDTNGRLVVDVTRIIKHGGYSELTMSNDIAILEVATTEATLEASTFAKPICLASRDYTSGEVAYVSGWGTTEEGAFFFFFFFFFLFFFQRAV